MELFILVSSSFSFKEGRGVLGGWSMGGEESIGRGENYFTFLRRGDY